MRDPVERREHIPTDALGRERRTVTVPKPEIRAAKDDGPIGFKGHAAVFDSRTWIGPPKWGFWEEVAGGAFAKTIKEADVRFLINHDPMFILARTAADNLRLSEDKVGLATDADMTPTTYARDLALSLAAGDISQMSFAFRAVKEEWTELDDGSEVRTLKEVQLYDVSAVTYPAYNATDAALRSLGLDMVAKRLDEDPHRLAEALGRGPVDDEYRALCLRAGEALTAIATDLRQPASATGEPSSEPAPATRVPMALQLKRHQLNARRYGLA